MNKDCAIAQDIMPLYNDDLLQKQTATWFEEHIYACEQCQQLLQWSRTPIQGKPIESPIDYNKMMNKMKRKLSIYQVILVGLSFYFAIKSSLLNNSFGFILSYTFLGFIVYLFYRQFWLVTTIAFLPVFIWSLTELVELNFHGFIGSLFVGLIHLGVALIGSVIGWLTMKFLEEGVEK